MPLKKGKSDKIVAQNIRELMTGKTFAKTKAKYGEAKARKQAIAIALEQQRKHG